MKKLGVRLLPAVIGAAAVVLAACSSDLVGPPTAYNAAANSNGSPPGSNSGLNGTLNRAIPLSTNSLLCERRATVSDSALIGPSGGTLTFGKNHLVVPPGALLTPTMIKGTILEADELVVLLEPSGLQFRKPAGLILDATSCTGSSAVSLFYFDDQGNVLERIEAIFSNLWKTFAAPIDHFSRYGIAVRSTA